MPKNSNVKKVLVIGSGPIVIGQAAAAQTGYFVGAGCIGCKLCYSVCPQKCIDITKKPAVIDQHHCLHCGRCAETCPARAIR